MVGTPADATALTSRLSRRKVLATMGVLTAAPVSGCGAIGSPEESAGEGETIEVMVENRTDEPAQLGVRVEDEDGAALFSRVYELEPGHLDSSAGIDTAPSTVIVFTPEDTSASWEYAPGPDVSCDGEDIGITVQPGGSINSWYAC